MISIVCLISITIRVADEHDHRPHVLLLLLPSTSPSHSPATHSIAHDWICERKTHTQTHRKIQYSFVIKLSSRIPRMNAFGSIDSPFFFFCYSSNTNSYRKIKKGSWPRIYIEFGALRWSGAWQMSGSALCYEQYTLYCRLKQFRIATVWTFNPRSAESINHIIFDADGNIAVISSPTSPPYHSQCSHVLSLLWLNIYTQTTLLFRIISAMKSILTGKQLSTHSKHRLAHIVRGWTFFFSGADALR